MRCLNCDYPLWDLKPGPCPECGTPFDPTEHEFRTGSVRFCCPHCDQSYYGDDEKGHLQPRSFNCVNCGEAIDESECVVRPLEGGSHADSVTFQAPWFDDSVGFVKRFLRTVGWSMTKPARLGRELPPRLGMGSGVAFYTVTQGLVTLGTAITFAVWYGIFLASMAGGGGAGMVFGGTVLVTILMTIAGLIVSILGLIVSGALVHLVLRVGGETHGGIGRSISALGFGTGPLVLSAVPFLGTWCLGSVGGVWSLVSMIIVLKGAQRVSGLRASLAVLSPVAILIALYVGVIGVLVLGGIGGIGGMAGLPPAPPALVNMNPGTDVATAWDGKASIPDPATAAAEFPEVFSADGKTVIVEGSGYAGWFQARELMLHLQDGSILQASYDPIAGGCRVRISNAGISSSSFFQPADAGSIRRELQGAITEAGGVPDLSLELIEGWVSLSDSLPFPPVPEEDG